MNVYFEHGDANRRTRWVFDEEYQTRGSYALDTDEETRAAEDWELERLEDGRLIALGCIKERKCSACGQWEQIDSLWGIVIEPDEAALKAFERESM